MKLLQWCVGKELSIQDGVRERKLNGARTLSERIDHGVHGEGSFPSVYSVVGLLARVESLVANARAIE
jgi:hypothetical protein